MGLSIWKIVVEFMHPDVVSVWAKIKGRGHLSTFSSLSAKVILIDRNIQINIDCCVHVDCHSCLNPHNVMSFYNAFL